jgi:hypothetical protein
MTTWRENKPKRRGAHGYRISHHFGAAPLTFLPDNAVILSAAKDLPAASSAPQPSQRKWETAGSSYHCKDENKPITG